MADKLAGRADAHAHQVMTAGRLETFSDGVLAIIITVMVLNLKVPAGDDLAALRHAAGRGLLTYLLSFVYIGIYWNNHHHLFLLTSQITGSILWANLQLLFWLSLLPFTTAWMDETGLARTPMTVYGVNLLAAALAFVLLQAVIIHFQGDGSPLRQAIGRDSKGKASMLLYLVAISCSCISTSATRAATVACFVAVAILWLVPDRRIKRVLDQDDRPQAATLVARQHGPVAPHPEHR
jgi:uncharacterized membrane protein